MDKCTYVYAGKVLSFLLVYTPIFFVHRDKFYIGSQCPCLVEGLHDSNKEKFIYHYNVSNREYDISN